MTHAGPRSQLPTHDVENQPEWRAGFDLWDSDPVLRTHYFEQPLTTRYVRIVSTAGPRGSSSAGAAEVGFLPAR